MGVAQAQGPQAGSLRGGLVVAAGGASLAVAMGIGRFAYTSILPMMVQGRALTLVEGSTLAMVNYIGYLLGALACMGLPTRWSSAVLMRLGLVVTLLGTAAMVVPCWPLWLVLRFVAGVASAVTFVHSVRWCLGVLSVRGRSALGSLMFVGVGSGIAVSGLAATVMIASHWGWQAGWAGFALVGLLLVAPIWPVVDPRSEPRAGVPLPMAEQRRQAQHDRHSRWHFHGEAPLFALAYGIAGFGCIITATYLPLIARSDLPPSVWLDLFWPIYGVAAAAGSALVTRIHRIAHPRTLLAACYFMQGAGVVATIFRPTLAGFILGSIIAGLPFTAINYLAMEEARRMRPQRAARFIGLLTAAFAIGQLLGPMVVSRIARWVPDLRQAFDLSLGLAGGALAFGGLTYLVLRWVYPSEEGTGSAACFPEGERRGA